MKHHSENFFKEAKDILKGGEIKTNNLYFLSYLYSWNAETIGISLNINQYLGLPSWAVKSMIKIIVEDIDYKGNIFFHYRARKKDKHIELKRRISNVMFCSTKTAEQIRLILERWNKDPYKEFGIQRRH